MLLKQKLVLALGCVDCPLLSCIPQSHSSYIQVSLHCRNKLEEFCCLVGFEFYFWEFIYVSKICLNITLLFKFFFFLVSFNVILACYLPGALPLYLSSIVAILMSLFFCTSLSILVSVSTIHRSEERHWGQAWRWCHSAVTWNQNFLSPKPIFNQLANLLCVFIECIERPLA
jgi:hypothetical protein